MAFDAVPGECAVLSRFLFSSALVAALPGCGLLAATTPRARTRVAEVGVGASSRGVGTTRRSTICTSVGAASTLAGSKRNTARIGAVCPGGLSWKLLSQSKPQPVLPNCSEISIA